MKAAGEFFLVISSSALIFTMSCGRSSSQSASAPAIVNPARLGVGNILPIAVGGPYALAGPATNRAMVAITLCTPDTEQCQYLDNIMLDTASTGLRIFASEVTIPTTPVIDGNGLALAECANFDSISAWGPLASIDLRLAGETRTLTSIQLINNQFAQVPTSCAASSDDLDIDAQGSGFNGILGISSAQTDCGINCETTTPLDHYFSCSGQSCNSVPMPIATQLKNPISLLPLDNNGYALVFDSLKSTVGAELDGELILGIGTQANNQPVALTVLDNDSTFHANLAMNGVSMPFLFDTGTAYNILPSTPQLEALVCPSDPDGHLCPSQSLTVNLQLGGHGQTPTLAETTLIAAEPVAAGNNVATSTAALVSPDLLYGSAVLGLPFFFGKTIYFGLDGAETPVGIGPFNALAQPMAGLIRSYQ